jgi:putative flippase GtrA
LAQRKLNLSRFNLVLRYGFFAVVATLANLGAQRLSFAFAPEGTRLIVALVCGTSIGLIVKYVLDKRWIFHDYLRPVRQEARMFMLYTLTGVVTTLVFWGMESGFWLVWKTHGMRELGAVMGLVIGYVIKFKLDRHYIFQMPA